MAGATVATRNATLYDKFIRGTGNKFSNYLAGQGACGWYNSDTEFVVALTHLEWDNGANCGKEISISWQGKSTTAKICMSCPWDGLDFSQSLFSFFVGEGNNEEVGIIYGEWSYLSGGGGDVTSSTITTKDATTTSTQKKTTTSTTTTSTTTMSTTTSSTSTTSSTATSKVASTAVTTISLSDATSASASLSAKITNAAAPTQSSGPQNLGDFNQAILALTGLIVDAQSAT
ncbi:hypothetical protein DFH09DRAFT_1333021 [Mycena vulgaris]|nr:hypothetical protein DFH09DRAFT_1333021 [Mycena vulgaris]